MGVAEGRAGARSCGKSNRPLRYPDSVVRTVGGAGVDPLRPRSPLWPWKALSCLACRSIIALLREKRTCPHSRPIRSRRSGNTLSIPPPSPPAWWMRSRRRWSANGCGNTCGGGSRLGFPSRPRSSSTWSGPTAKTREGTAASDINGGYGWPRTSGPSCGAASNPRRDRLYSEKVDGSVRPRSGMAPACANVTRGFSQSPFSPWLTSKTTRPCRGIRTCHRCLIGLFWFSRRSGPWNSPRRPESDIRCGSRPSPSSAIPGWTRTAWPASRPSLDSSPGVRRRRVPWRGFDGSRSAIRSGSPRPKGDRGWMVGERTPPRWGSLARTAASGMTTPPWTPPSPRTSRGCRLTLTRGSAAARDLARRRRRFLPPFRPRRLYHRLSAWRWAGPPMPTRRCRAFRDIRDWANRFPMAMGRWTRSGTISSTRWGPSGWKRLSITGTERNDRRLPSAKTGEDIGLGTVARKIWVIGEWAGRSRRRWTRRRRGVRVGGKGMIRSKGFRTGSGGRTCARVDCGQRLDGIWLAWSPYREESTITYTKEVASQGRRVSHVERNPLGRLWERGAEPGG